MSNTHYGLQCPVSQDIVISFLGRPSPITKGAEYLKAGHAVGQEEFRSRHIDVEFYAASFINSDNFSLT